MTIRWIPNWWLLSWWWRWWWWWWWSWWSWSWSAGFAAAAPIEPGCGWIATRAVANNHAVQNHDFHNHPSQLSFTVILSSKPHHHLISVSSMQTAGEHFLLCLRVFLAFPSDLQILSGYFRVTGRFNCLFVFSLCVCVLFFFSFYHGRSLLDYCAHCVFLCYSGACKIMANPKT